MPKLKNICIALLCLCVFSFCKRNPTTWQDDLVAPLATGNLTLANLFPDTIIKANADSSLKISFESNLINYGLDSLIKIPDTTITTAFTFSFGIVSTPITPGMNITLANNSPTESPYNLPNGIQLKKAIVKQGMIEFTMQNTVYQPLVYHYRLLSATKNNHILDTTFNIPKADSANGQPGVLNGAINLAGYVIDFSGLHNGFNTTVETDSVHIASNASPNGHLYNNQGITSKFKFHEVIPQYALGYFGNQSITIGPDTASFVGFNSIKKGLLNLNSANVSVCINNQFGVAMKANLNQITSINTYNPSSVTLNTQALNNIFVASAFNNGLYAPVTASTKTITLNNSNSNVKDFIGNLPGKLSYKLTAQINPPPASTASGNNDFGYYGTSFSANLKMDVPLFFSASNLMLTDTVSINVSSVSQLQNINRGNIILTATNSYPFSINLNAVLLDENKHPIENLFNSPGLLEAPPLDVNGKVVGSLKSKLYVPLTPQKLTNVQKARYVAYSATFNTVNQPNQVKFYSNYTLDLLLTADLNYTVGK